MQLLDPVYTVPDPHGHDMKLDSFKTGAAFKVHNNIAEFNSNSSSNCNTTGTLTQYKSSVNG